MGSKNHTDFKKVHTTLVQSAPKKSYAQKPIFLVVLLVFCLTFLGAFFNQAI
jgi:hypothetical protein